MLSSAKCQFDILDCQQHNSFPLFVSLFHLKVNQDDSARGLEKLH